MSKGQFQTSTQNAVMFDFCILHLDGRMSAVGNGGHFMFSGDLAKLTVTVADVDRVHRNSAIFFAIKSGIVGAEFG